MREFFQLVNEYPWTTFFLVIGLCCVLEALGKVLPSTKGLFDKPINIQIHGSITSDENINDKKQEDENGID